MGCGLVAYVTEKGSLGEELLEARSKVVDMNTRIRSSVRVRSILKQLHLLDKLCELDDSELSARLIELKRTPGLVEKLKRKSFSRLKQVLKEETGTSLPSPNRSNEYVAAMKKLEAARDHPLVKPIYEGSLRLYQAIIGLDNPC